jgi:hypothetical protein
LICCSDSLTHVLIEKVECSNWEKNRKTESIKHGDPNNIKDSRTLEMDDVVSSKVKIFVSSHRSLFGLINILRETLV